MPHWDDIGKVFGGTAVGSDPELDRDGPTHLRQDTELAVQHYDAATAYLTDADLDPGDGPEG